MATNGKSKHMQTVISLLPSSKLILFFLFWLLLVLFFVSNPNPLAPSLGNNKLVLPNCSPGISPFYIHNLPANFNQALLNSCRTLNLYMDMCPAVANQGLGQPINESWYATNQFISEIIFHARAENHPCRTLDPGAARLFYVPFYAGLYASSRFREKDVTVRDAMAVELAEFVVKQPEWGRMNGKDHFMMAGRTSWDFMRSDKPGSNDVGGNRLFFLPPMTNMSILTVERQPWQGHNQFGIPYPSYFHPRTATEVTHWQDHVRQAKRTHLFSFVGGPRPGTTKMALARETIIRQCVQSEHCYKVQCIPRSAEFRKCHEPDQVLGVMKRSVFCMQPPGDSFTRRSVFDTILAGCVPVFFSAHTAYSQYQWYIPAQRDEWSVFIEPNRWDYIEEELNRIPKEKVERMRQKVIEMIPSVTYAHPNVSHQEVGMHDAVDIALEELSRHVRTLALRDSTSS